MKISLNFELKEVSKGSRYQIFLRLTELDDKKRKKRIDTGIKLTNKAHFKVRPDGYEWITKKEPSFKRWNEDLKLIYDRYYNLINDLNKEEPGASIDEIERITNTVNTGLINYSESILQMHKESGNFANYKVHLTYVAHLKDFLSNRDIPLQQLTSNHLRGFEHFLSKQHNQRNPDQVLHRNTIHKNIKILRAIINRAIKEGLIKKQNDPFDGYETPTKLPSVKIKLSWEQIDSLASIELPKDTNQWHARNIFLFAFYGGGMRFADCIQLRWFNIKNDGSHIRLQYSMDKNDKIVDLALPEQAIRILNLYHRADYKQTDYIFPFLNDSAPYAKYVTTNEILTMPAELNIKRLAAVSAKNALMNKYLKEVGKIVGIDGISMHVARHSIANMLMRSGVNNNITKNILNHSSLAITENYMGNFATSEKDKALLSVFEKDKSKGELMKIIDELPAEKIKELLSNLKAK